MQAMMPGLSASKNCQVYPTIYFPTCANKPGEGHEGGLRAGLWAIPIELPIIQFQPKLRDRSCNSIRLDAAISRSAVSALEP